MALAEPVQHREDFNPRSPHGERHTFAPDAITCKGKFQSTLPARGATPPRWAELFSASISIHAPRTGSDATCPFRACARLDLFQSTLPARGATRRGKHFFAICRFQSTLPARGATRRGKHFFAICRFQSTLPARGATNPRRNHARQQIYFNPRSPHGERRARNQRTPTGADFNPRSPHGERPVRRDVPPPCVAISIHAPRTGSDIPLSIISRQDLPFQSTLPARGAT